ncbi:MAG: acyl-CoA dehydrogenase family protein [Acidimicrobiales bacterium]
MDAEDRELFDRSLGHATATHTGEALDAALDELGWGDALALDPEAAVALLFEHQGFANATSTALDRVLTEALGAEPDAMVLPALGRTDPPGNGATVHGLGTATLPRAKTAAVVTSTDGAELCTLRVDAAELELRPVSGIDPELGLVEVTGAAKGLEVTPLDPGLWEAAVAAGQRALAHELVGASRAMLALARDHAVERIQFGVPIASFQAVRHRLADSFVAVEAADAALGAAWLDGSPLAAALAKAIAGRNGRTVARHAQQVLAGIGFTTEHDLHHHLRRTYVLDGLLGDARSLTIELGQQLLATRQVPALLPL